jgi:hypothetical protein
MDYLENHLDSEDELWLIRTALKKQPGKVWVSSAFIQYFWSYKRFSDFREFWLKIKKTDGRRPNTSVPSSRILEHNRQLMKENSYWNE